MTIRYATTPFLRWDADVSHDISRDSRVVPRHDPTVSSSTLKGIVGCAGLFKNGPWAGV